MSNQRVVVLTDDEILLMQMAVDRLEDGDTALVVSCLASLQAALEYPEGITDEQVKRGALALAKLDMAEHRESREGPPFSFGDKSKAVLEAALSSRETVSCEAHENASRDLNV